MHSDVLCHIKSDLIVHMYIEIKSNNNNEKKAVSIYDA